MLKENKKIPIENLMNPMNYSINNGWFSPESVIVAPNSNYGSIKSQKISLRNGN